MAKIDLDLFEKVIFQQCMKKDGIFLASCIDYIDKNVFKNKDIGIIMEVIKTFFLENDKIPSVTELKLRLVSTVLKDAFRTCVESIRNLDTDYSDEALYKDAEYFFKQRKYMEVVEKAIDSQATKKEIEADDIQREIDKAAAISLIDNLGLDFFGDNQRVVDFLLTPDKFISTGYKELDDAFGGGLYKEGKALYCISGETNVGKSIVLANIVVNVLLQDLNVVIYTLEMSEMRYAKRISAILTDIALATLPEKIDNYKAYIRDFVKKYKSRLIIKEFATKSISAKHIQAFNKKLKQRKDFVPAVMAFDYHLLMKASIVQPSKHAEMQFITQETRGLTYVFNCPAITVAQLNRSSHKATSPGLDAMSGSWDQNADYDSIVNIWQTDEDREANQLQYEGKKARDGGKGIAGVFEIDYNTLRLTSPHGAGQIIRDSADDVGADPNLLNDSDFDFLTKGD